VAAGMAFRMLEFAHISAWADDQVSYIFRSYNPDTFWDQEKTQTTQKLPMRYIAWTYSILGLHSTFLLVKMGKTDSDGYSQHGILIGRLARREVPIGCTILQPRNIIPFKLGDGCPGG
jgi:hypothetical protein